MDGARRVISWRQKDRRFLRYTRGHGGVIGGDIIFILFLQS